MNHKLELQLSVEKINKYASRESGDTVEIVERPHGGISVVMADGQRSGLSAKAISNIVVRKAISLLADGVRDGAVARATHDYLRTQRGGKVSAELNIVSVDLVTGTLVISRNSRCPVLVRTGGNVVWLDDPCEAVGIRPNTKPSITEMELAPDLTVIVFTDGIWSAGSYSGTVINLPGLIQNLELDHSYCVPRLAEAILSEALRLDSGRPRDDATVLVLALTPTFSSDNIRRLQMRFPI